MIRMNRSANIVMVEDDASVSEYFEIIISGANHLNLATIARSVSEAKQVSYKKIDLVLVDIGLPDGSGLDVITHVKRVCDARILVVTTFGDRRTILTAVSNGADGYLLKDGKSDAILEGIDLTLAGDAPISPSAAVHLLRQIQGRHSNEKLRPVLTERETEVLKLFAKGCKYNEVADIIKVSRQSVGNYVKSIYRKLGVNSRSEAVYEALTAGFIEL